LNYLGEWFVFFIPTRTITGISLFYFPIILKRTSGFPKNKDRFVPVSSQST